MPGTLINKRKGRNILINAGLACMVTVLTLALAEVALQIHYRHQSLLLSPYRQQSLNEVYCSRFISHPYLPYASRPGKGQSYIYENELHGTFDTTKYSINSIGFRFPLKGYQKEENEKVIVFLGGSTTWDGPDDKHTWPAILTERLNLYYKNENFKITEVNLSVDGGNSAQSVINLLLWGVCFKPDLVISYDGINDYYDIGEYKNTLPDYSDVMRKFDDRIRPFIRHFPTFSRRLILVHIICNAVDRLSYGEITVNGQTYIAPPIPANKWQISMYESFRRNIRCMKAISAEYKSPFLAAIPHVFEPGDSYFQFCNAMKAGWTADSITYLNMLDSLPIHDAGYHYDHVHFTPTGLQAVANSYENYIIHHNLLKIE